MLADLGAAGALGDLDLDRLAGAAAREVRRRAETALVELVAEVADSADAADEDERDDQAGAAVAAFLPASPLRLAARRGFAVRRVVVEVVVLVAAAGEEGVLALVGAAVPVGLVRCGLGLRRSGWRRLGGCGGGYASGVP